MQKIIAAFCIKNDRTFCKNPFFHSISGNERKTFGLWDKNCLQGCENCIVRDLGNILARKNFCPKKCNFPSSSDIRRIFCGRRSKTAIYVSIGTFLLEFSSWKELNFFITFGDWAKIFWPSGKRCRRASQNCTLRVHTNIWRFRENVSICSEKVILLILLQLWAKYFGFLGKTSWQDCPNSVVRDHRNILSRNSLLKKVHYFNIFGQWAKTFWPPGKHFRRGYKNCILRVQMNFWRFEKTCQNVFKKFFILSFCSFGQKVSASWTRFTAGISKIRCNWKYEPFE